MARLVPGLARVVGVDTGHLYSLARDAEGGVLGGAGPADQGQGCHRGRYTEN